MADGAIGVMMQGDMITSVTGNTFSGGLLPVDLKNSADVTISDNTFYLPSTNAISIIEDASVPAGAVQNNMIMGNTLLTHNTSVPMIYIDDQNDDIGTLATLSSNTYLNTYKYGTSILEILAAGTGTLTYDKNSILDIDPTATQFNYFGYSSYTGDETRLVVNTGSVATDIACPPMTVCAQMVDTTNSTITWPINVPAYRSKVALWNNSPNILRAPVCSLVPSAGSVANGDPVTLTWNVTNGTGTTLTEPTATGGSITNPIPNSGSGVYYPPMDDQVNHYELTTENVIGTNVCPADVTAQNNPPLQSVFFATGSEDALTITGTLEATDSTGDTIYFELFTNTTNGTTSINTFNGLVTYTPNPDFCGVDTFNWRAYDQFNRYSDPAVGTITVLCENDTPIAVDDNLGATGGQLAVLEVTLNDTDPDSPYVAQTYTVS
ncbi:MAG: Ig-like domain-containing protein [Patescibacteria group bacterium]